MEHEYTLHVISTGELIERQWSRMSLLAWQRKVERKILKSGNRAERFKEAIRAGDTLAGWTSPSFEALVRSNCEDFDREYRRVMRGVNAKYKD